MAERASGIPVKRKTMTSVGSKDAEVEDKDLTAQSISKCSSGTSSELAETSVKPETDKTGHTHHTNKTEKDSTNKDIDMKSDDIDSDAKNRGPCSSFSVAEHSETPFLYYAMFGLVTLLAFITRLYKIEVPAWICWDETHFGKMGSWYIRHSFFFDVHPPLGKMLIGLAGYLSGYDGGFAFNKPGDEYGDVKYVGMRVFCACLGALLVPLVYKSTWLLSKSVTASVFASSFVLLDTGVNTLSRHILLDPILMFFIMSATYTLLKFLALRDRPFTFRWWFWLSLTGVFLACSIGVKFVGLFVILLAGYSTIEDLWRLLGNQALSLVLVMKHFVARAACLIGIPALVYMLIFYIHFKVLYKSGGGDGFYSSQFQSQLEGNKLYNISMPDKIAYGSVISLKQQRTGGGYLHSHWHLYPEEYPPRQQQITSYSHKDENNMWRVKPALEESDIETPPLVIRNGDLVRLEHVITHRNLHSHKEPAPLTPRNYQASGYGQDGIGDANDIWQIHVPGTEEGSEVRVIRSKIKLIHYHVRCALHSHDKKLPKWGWEQLEVTCNPNVKDRNTLWSVEEVIDPRLPNVSFEVYTPSFLEKFIESHSVMTQGNAGLKPKEGEVTSRPWQWPINMRGQIFSGKDHKIYLLGNPVIWFGLLGTKALFLLLYSVHAVRQQRGAKSSTAVTEFSTRMFSACWWLLIGWSLHYWPFWPMTRVLYFHHYFPAFLYSAMLGGVIIDYTIKMICLKLPASLSTCVFHVLVGLLLSGTSYSFYLFHPLTYGMPAGTSHDASYVMHGLRWLDSWDF